MNMYKHCSPVSGSMMGGGFVFWILAIALVIVIIYLLTKSSKTQPTNTPQASSTALRILEERYAKGEIDETEFELKRRHIENK